MVEKEIDASLAGELSDSGVVFLPYASDEKIRPKLTNPKLGSWILNRCVLGNVLVKLA